MERSHTNGPRKDSHCPITVNMLRDFAQLLGTIFSSEHEAALFRAAFLTAFVGAFRISKLVPGSRRDSTGKALELCDVHWKEPAVILNL